MARGVGSSESSGTRSSDQNLPKYLYRPRLVQGWLLKDSPAPWRRCGMLSSRVQMRFVVVSEGRLFWSQGDTVDSAGLPVEMAGVIDLVVNECEVIDDGGLTFLLVPKDGKWVEGDFTGVSRGRAFRFDASASGVNKQRWMTALREHLEYAAVARASSPTPEPSALPSVLSFARSFLSPTPAAELLPCATFGSPDSGDPVISPRPSPRARPRKSVRAQQKGQGKAPTRCLALACHSLCSKKPTKKAGQGGSGPSGV